MNKKTGLILGIVIVLAIVSFITGNMLAGSSWGLFWNVFGGGMVGVAVATVLVAMTKESKEDCLYDERQIAARGKAFQYGFFTLLCFNMLYFCLELCEVPVPVAPAMIPLIGALLGLLVMTSYCIWKDAYWQLNQKRGNMMGIFFFIGAIDMIGGIKNCLEGEVLVNGVITDEAMPLAAGVMFLLIGLVFAAKAIQEKMEDRS